MLNLVYDNKYLKLQDYIRKSVANKRICRLFIIFINFSFAQGDYQQIERLRVTHHI